jgi:hypothetical protein
MIIFDKFGDGQSERNRSVPVFPDNPMRTHGRIQVSLLGPRVASHAPRAPLSNRELDLLERPLSHCKQGKATVSNRELSTIDNAPKVVNLVPFWISERPSRALISAPNFRRLTTFLPGSDRKVEVTEKKRLNPVYPGLELHVTVAQSRAEFPTESQAQSEKDCRSRDAAEQSKIPLTIRNEKELS